MISKFTHKFSEKLDVAARILFMAMMLLVVVNVISRSLGHPFHGASEWVGFLMACAIGLALSYCAAQGGHVAVTILFERISGKKRVIAELIVNILVLIFLIMVVRMMILYGIRLFEGGHVGMTSRVPLHYFAYVIAVGIAGYSAVVLGEIVELFKKVGKR